MTKAKAKAKVDEQRLAVANEVLSWLTAPKGTTYGVWLVAKGNSLFVRIGPLKKFRWQVAPGQDFYPVWKRELPYGGTTTIALSQLIRWVQGKSCVPLGSWLHWTGPRCRLARDNGPEVVRLLRAGGWPEQVPCVLCRRMMDVPGDWWNLDGTAGPCCSMTDGCKQERKTDELV